ncbi:MAG: MBL fold metallo-hydrolase [Propionibacteriaceae bacterium]
MIRPVHTLDVAPGVHRIEHAHTNCYIVVDDHRRATVVDACFPATWAAVDQCLAAARLTADAVEAVVLTHGHFDHVGFARRVQQQFGVPVWVHRDDRDLAAHPYRYRPQKNRIVWPLFHPGGLPVLTTMVAAGALRVVGVAADRELTDETTVPVPGSPVVAHLPGHTAGQCALLLPDRDVVLSGDALVTLDPYTGRRGPRLVAPAATADVAQARRSLDRLDGTARVLLPGHGDPWTGGVAAAVERARREPGVSR